MHDLNETLMTAAQVRAEFGGISDMTLWRWLKDEELDFPQPIVINGRRYFYEQKVREFKRARAPRVMEAA
jgi:predicted DNA-binding transcriptional regulator AlpA